MALTRLPGFTLDSTSSFTFANASVTANVTAGNIKTDNLLYANGTPWELGGTYANSNVEAYLPTYTGQMANALVAGTVYTNAQPNITSVGTLSSVTVSGLITATAGGIKVGNIQDTSGTNTIQVSSGTTGIVGNLNVGTGGTGNVTATYFIGNGSQLTGLPATYSNADVANYLPTYTGNFAASNISISNSLTVSNISNLGNVGNVKVTGGSLGQFLKTDGTGNLTWDTVGTAATITYTPAFKGAMLSASGNTALAAATWQKINLVTINYDSTGGGLTGTASRFTIPAGVTKVQLFGSVTGATQTDQLLAQIYKNGTTFNGSTDIDVDSTGQDAPSAFSAVVPVVEGDYFELWAFSQLARNIVPADPTWFSVSIIEGSILNTTVSTTIGMSTLNDVDVSSNAPTSGQSLVWNSSSSKWIPSNESNLTSIGTLTNLSVSGNATITGNLTVGGNVNYINVDTLVIEDPIIEQGGGANGAPLTTNDGKDRGSLLHYYTTEVVDAFMGWDNSAGEFAFGSNVSISSEVVTFNTLGNVRASTFIGSLSGAATTAATVTTNAQPNITSIGTLTSLSVTANITSGNINGGNAIVANYFVGDGSLLTGLPASYANANVANYLPTYTGNLSPSNLVVSTTANLGAVGNVIITGGTANYVLTTDGAGTLSWAAQSGGGSSTSTTIAVDNFTGNGVADTYTLSVTPTSVNSVFVNYNGAFVGRGSYSLSGANLTFGSVPANGASIEVTTIEGLTIGSGAFTTRTATGDGSETDYTVTSGATVSSVLATLDGVLQTPTSDYTISGTTLTFTTAPYNGAAIQIRELAVAASSGGGGGASNTSIRAQAMTMGIIFGG